jgi:hypothetical protein
MKKIVGITLMLCIIITMCIGCTPKTQVATETKQVIAQKSEIKIKYLEGKLTDKDSQYNIVSKGKYFMFSCQSSDEYVMFLDELDESIYEIVNIQIEHFDDGNFFVTYKKK